MVFPEGAVRCLRDIGDIPVGGELGVACSQRFHLADPDRDAVLGKATSPAPIVLPTFARRMYSNHYRATVARHFQEVRAADLDPGQRLTNRLAGSPPFDALTGRERNVCQRILLGFSSEAISAELGIRLHSTLTYRKRVYG